MRPLRLSMTAFGPYAGTEVVDFDALAQLGLFAVAGNNGSGKTTIFDGLYFALYGSLPGRRSTYGRLRSDHAEPDVECQVVFDFLAHGRHWRIERTPKQLRAKRRGTGSTERQQRATLYSIEDDQPTAVVNRIADVNKQCRELVGLTGPQFERVALLPQGEFSRLLRESGSERRELLRALFSSDVFGDATALLVADAAEAAASGNAALAQLDRRVDQVAEQLSEATGTTIQAGAPELMARLAQERASTLEPLYQLVERDRAAAAQATNALHVGVALTERQTQHDQLTAKLAEHHANQATVDRDQARLAQARAAIPVVDIAQVATKQHQALAAIERDIDNIATSAADQLEQAGIRASIPETADTAQALRTQAEQEHGALATVIDAAEQVHTLEQSIARIDTELDKLVQVENATVAQRSSAAQRSAEISDLILDLPQDHDRDALDRRVGDLRQRHRLRRQLTALDLEHDEHRTRLQSCRAGLESLDARLQGLERAQREQPSLNQQAQSAAEALAALHQRRDRLHQIDTLHANLVRVRTAHAQALEQADQLFDAFARGAAGRLAETLVDGEPCAVCGATEHPEPAPASNEAASQADVASARQTADEFATQRRTLESEIEAIRTLDPELANAHADELAQAIEDATAHAVDTDNAANQNLGVVAESERVTAERANVVDQADGIAAAAAALSDQRNQLIGALGDDARLGLDHFETEIATATHALQVAERAIAQRGSLAAELTSLDERIAAIDLGRLTHAKQRSALQAERAARSSDLESAQARLGDENAGVQSPSSGAFDDPRFVVQARRRLSALDQVRGVLDRLAGALAQRSSATDAARRADLTVQEKLGPSPFEHIADAERAFVTPDVIGLLEASTNAHVTQGNHLQGQLQALGLVPTDRPDLKQLRLARDHAIAAFDERQRDLMAQTALIDRLEHELTAVEDERARLGIDELSARRVERMAGLVKGDNAHNTSLENWVLAAHLREVVELANVRLAQSTHQRFQLCVLDDGETRRGRWGLDLAVEDTVTGTRRPTAGLSGGELFQASLALALGLADVVMNQAAGVRIDALFIDEGFGSLDDASVERVIDLLDNVRSRGATVGVITHVAALLDVLPRGITVVPRSDGTGSTIQQPQRAA